MHTNVQVHCSEESTVSPDDTKAMRKGLRRVDGLILLPIVIMFVFLQFDRTNIGNALTDTFRKDAQLSQSDINLGQTLFTVGIVLLGQFVTRDELALRYALLWAANSVAGALGSVIALGLLSLDGRHGLHGWQWLFLIEGCLTCLLAVAAALHLPRGPSDASLRHRVFGGRFAILKPDQGELLQQRAMRDDPTKSTQRSGHIALRDFDCLLGYRIYGHMLMAFLSSIMYTPMNTYAPSIIKALGFRGYTANGLNSIGPACNVIIALSLAYYSDRTRRRGIFVLTGFLVSAIGLLWLALPPSGTARGILYAGVVFTEAGMGSVQGLNAAWLSENIEERQRPVALGCYVMSIQLASFVGANVFQASDAPRYVHGLLVCAGCVLAAAAVCVGWTVRYKFGYAKARR
ncbi:hypothetical protein LTR85_008303 [Meristemomyces frigidus]|nr:hypothetical protein LTR85_008303 [Meristemomyces frigidus]